MAGHAAIQMAERAALRWLVDEQAMPALMWWMVALSWATVAAALFLLLARMLSTPAPGERRVRGLLDLTTEVAPLSGIYGTVAGLVCSLNDVGQLDARRFLVSGLRTALYTTGYGVVIAALAMTVLFVTARSVGGRP
ncbi:MAG: MotA/TolQ/ExbB proton channel family protein [Planctomycetes bacterium]|nr:MotA/TolQ/ExbB proton channel family protein [Planctomycetota bacterium]